MEAYYCDLNPMIKIEHDRIVIIPNEHAYIDVQALSKDVYWALFEDKQPNGVPRVDAFPDEEYSLNDLFWDIKTWFDALKECANTNVPKQ